MALKKVRWKFIFTKSKYDIYLEKRSKTKKSCIYIPEVSSSLSSVPKDNSINTDVPFFACPQGDTLPQLVTSGVLQRDPSRSSSKNKLVSFDISNKTSNVRMTGKSEKLSVSYDSHKNKNWDLQTNITSVSQLSSSLLHNFNSSYSKLYGTFPSISSLASRGFGKPSRLPSFSSEATFDHTLILLLKSGFLNDDDVCVLAKVHPLYKHLIKTLVRALRSDFRPIHNLISKCADQEDIPRISIQRFLAAALYYNLHLASVIRFASGNYTATFRDPDLILKEIRGIAPDEICSNVDKLLRVGAPHHMTGHSTRSNFQTFKSYGNHSSIYLKPSRIKKVMNKEHKYQYVMAFPNWLARFVPNLHLTPQGLVVKSGKNGRLIFDASFKPMFDSLNINMTTNPKTAPPIEYGFKFKLNLARI